MKPNNKTFEEFLAWLVGVVMLIAFLIFGGRKK